MVWVRRDLIDYLVPTPLPWAGIPSTRSSCSNPHPTWPWTLPGRGSHSSSGESVPVPHYPHDKKFVPCLICNLNLPSHFKTSCLITTCPCKKSLSSFLVGPFQLLEGCYKVSLQPSLLQTEQPQLSQPFLTGEMLQSPHHPCSPLLDSLQ